VAALIALAPQSFWKRSESIADYAEDASFNERERAWAMFKVIADERPLSGVGAGGFVVAWDRYAPLNALGQRLIAHNVFMEIQGEQGAIALLLFAAFSTWLLVRLWGAGSGDGPWSADARAVFGGLAGYLICELVNGLSRTFDLYLLFAAAIVALAHARVRARLAAEAASP
jgi:O-antigen ligase